MRHLGKLAIVVGMAVGCGGAGDGEEPTGGSGASGAPEQGDAGSSGNLPEGGSGDSPVGSGGGAGAGNEAGSGAAGASTSMAGGGSSAMNGEGGEGIGGSGIATGGGGSDTTGLTCDPDPDALPGDELGDPNGCTYSGSVVVQGRSEQSGILVSIVGTVLKAETDAEGHFEIEGVPRGSKRVHFSYGDYQETIPDVIGDFRLDKSPIDPYIGTRISDGSIVRLTPPTADRVFYKFIKGGSNVTYVVDHECEPAALLPCSAATVSEDGSLLTCSTSDGLSAYAVPRDATKSVSLVAGARATFLGSDLLAYVKDGSTRVFEFKSRRDRIVGTAGPFGAVLSPDDEHVFFVNAEREILLGETEGDAAAVPVDSFTASPPGIGATFLPKFSADGEHVAYVPGYCAGPCPLRLLDMDGTVRTLGTLYAADSFQITPDSKLVVARLDTGAVVGFPTAGGAVITYSGAASFFPAFLGDGSTMTLPAGDSTILFDVATGVSLGGS